MWICLARPLIWIVRPVISFTTKPLFSALIVPSFRTLTVYYDTVTLSNVSKGFIEAKVISTADLVLSKRAIEQFYNHKSGNGFVE